MTIHDLIKPIALTTLILIALALRSEKAHAAGTESLVVASGCFWCVEADFEKVRGVREVVSGYTGGAVENPSYRHRRAHRPLRSRSDRLRPGRCFTRSTSRHVP